MRALVLVVSLAAICICCRQENSLPVDNRLQDIKYEHITPPRNQVTLKQPQDDHTRISGKSGSLTVYIDPQTGEFITPEEAAVPPDERLEPPASSSTSHEGLVEEPSPVPGGGIMVDLKGRFQSPLTATIDNDGELKIAHKPKE
jgi:hypothetical protein